MRRPPSISILHPAQLALVCGAMVIGICTSACAEDAAPAATPTPATAEDVEFFEKRVRPLLIARCHECHAADKQKANLRLDSLSGALAGGDTGPAIVPGKPDESLLVDAIRYGQTYQMPPKGRLPDEEVAILVDWVRRGAPWPTDAAATVTTDKPAPATSADFAARASHWCFQPLATTPAPAVRDTAWPRGPIDQFILAALEARGLAPAPPADKRAWLRRVTYDLIGLPPTPAEIAEFLADESPQAYEKVVDRLLASPHYGERQARHWLDLARFAETYGHEHDFEIPNAYPYRDYLIRAFNADLPYDLFVIEQLAGDLVDPPRRHPAEHFHESIIGTAFWFLGESTHSPVDVREDEAKRIDNQIDVFSKTFLALTVGCARCHDHKFDCITQCDYYALAGYLQSSRYQQAFLDDPTVLVPTLRNLAELRRMERMDLSDYMRSVGQSQSQRLATALISARENKEATQRLIGPSAAEPEHVFHAWQQLVLSAPAENAEGENAFAKRRADLAARLAERSQSQTSTTAILYEDFSAPDFAGWTATGAAFGFSPAVVGDLVPALVADKDAVGTPVRFATETAAHSGLLAGKLQGVLRSPTFTMERPKIFYRVWGTGGQVRLIVDGLQLIQDPIYGGLKFGPGSATSHWHEQRVDKWIGHRAYIEIVDDGDGWLAVDRIEFDDHAPPPAPPNSLVTKMLENPAIQSPQDLAAGYAQLVHESLHWLLTSDWPATLEPAAADRVAVINAWLAASGSLSPEANDPQSGAERQATQKFASQCESTRSTRAGIGALLPAPRRSLAMADGTPENEHVFIRGNHRTLGDEVPRRVLTVLGGEQHSAPATASGRREMAEHLVDGSVPLVPRVMVNRLWQHHFGRGIVPTPDDFGAMGQRPTHPELLDWLATEFMRQGWSIKTLERQIVLSSAYRMSAAASSAAVAADPENRLWHHMPRRRLEAESIRDAVLATSGRLDRTMFGPGVAPYLTTFMSGRGRPKDSGPLDGAGRRSIYLNVRRNFLSPMMLAFDYPTPFTTIGRRSSSNVPAQALTMLDNPFVAEQATVWVRRILAIDGPIPRERISQMYLEAFGRPPDKQELATVESFLSSEQTSNDPEETAHAWTNLAHVLFNAKEFVFIE